MSAYTSSYLHNDHLLDLWHQASQFGSQKVLRLGCTHSNAQMRQKRLNELKMHSGTYGLGCVCVGHNGDDNEILDYPLFIWGPFYLFYLKYWCLDYILLIIITPFLRIFRGVLFILLDLFSPYAFNNDYEHPTLCNITYILYVYLYEHIILYSCNMQYGLLLHPVVMLLMLSNVLCLCFGVHVYVRLCWNFLAPKKFTFGTIMFILSYRRGIVRAGVAHVCKMGLHSVDTCG